MSETNGNGNGGSGATESTAYIPTHLDLVAGKAAATAARKTEIAEQRELGRDGRDIVAPLRSGPQTYTDPAMYGPNYRLRGAPVGQENSTEEIEAMKRVPLTQDKRLEAVGKVLDELDADLGGWPGDDYI